MIVIDASVLATALVSDDDEGDHVRQRVAAAGVLAAPELIDLEVVSVLRRQVLGDALDLRRAHQALRDLQDLPLVRVPHLLLLERAWELRDNVTTYDAAYVVLAELLGVTLVTGDRRLANAPGLRCDVELLPAG